MKPNEWKSAQVAAIAAARAADWETVFQLLDEGLNVNLQDTTHRETLLLIALRHLPPVDESLPEEIKLPSHIARLLQYGADANLGDRILWQFPLHEATGRGFYPVVELLILHGADVNLKKILDPADPDPLLFDATPLHLAASLDFITTMKMLLRHGARVDELGHAGQTPLHAAAMGAGGRQAAAALLLQHRANINAQCEGELADCYLKGETPLHLAVAFLYPKLVRYLLSQGASMQIKDARGRTPIDIAEKNLFRVGPETWIGGPFPSNLIPEVRAVLGEYCG